MATQESLVAPEWELIDPTPDPIALFMQYNTRFFWGKLDSVVVRWSPQMTSYVSCLVHPHVLLLVMMPVILCMLPVGKI